MPKLDLFQNEILDCLQKLILIADKNGNILYHSDNIKNVFNVSSEQVINRNIFDFIHPDEKIKTEKLIAGILSEPERSVPFELRIILDSYAEKYVSGRATDMSKDPRICGIIAVYSDVSKEKISTELQKAVFSISDLLNQTDDIDVLFKKIHSTIGSLIPSENFFVAVLDQEGKALSFPCYIDRFDSQPAPRAVTNSLTDYVVLKGSPLLLSGDSLDEFCDVENIDIQGTAPFSWLGVPLKCDNFIIGALVVQSYDEEFSYSYFHQNILEFVANHISAAMVKKQSHIKEREYKQFLEKIIENLPISLFAKDKEGRFIMWNKTSEELYGLKQEQVIGRTDFDFFPENQAEFFRFMDNKTLQSNKVFDIPEEPIDSPKFGRRILHTIKMPITDDNGEATVLLGLSDDITEKKLNEDILRLQHELAVRIGKTTDLNEALNYILFISIESIEEVDSGGIYIVEQDTGGLALAAHSGFKDSFVKKIQFYEKDSPKGLVARKEIPTFLSKKEIQASEFPAVIEEGIRALAILPILHMGSPIACLNLASHENDDFSRISKRLLSQVVSFLGDIIAKIQSDHKIRVSESKFRNTFENAPVGMSIMDSEGHYLAVNKSLCEMLGYNERELLKKKFSDLTYPDDLYKSMKNINSLILNEKDSIQFEKRYYHKSGKIIWVLLSSFAFREEEGSFGRIITHVIDITERKQIEDQLSKMRNLESLGLLAGGIAHDFNNILTTISGNISIANLYTQEDEDLKESLLEAEKGVKKATDLTQQLLTFAKGGVPVKEASSISEIITDSAKFILSGTDINLEYDFEKNLRVVDVDKSQFSQVIQNLVLNSVQAMPGGGTIKITARNHDLSEDQLEKYKYLYYLKPGKYIKISITDTGIGIHPDDILKIFDPYFTTKENGSGLGLSIVYSIIKNHSGMIEVDSEPQKGASFNIFIPASDSVAFFKNGIKSKQIKHGKANILLMDDEEMIRKVTSKMLEELGYRVETARNGEEAISKFREPGENPFDLIILDLTVQGGMGGKETVREIRKINPSVKALVSSGYSNDLALSNFSEFGFDNYLVKPFTLSDLSEKITETLGSNLPE
ncbi:PAS domain S-box protein [candidate division WOR-3 bacterium]|nr:PAS domain S-box protein [candidate division WOR-3 bacterium]